MLPVEKTMNFWFVFLQNPAIFSKQGPLCVCNSTYLLFKTSKNRKKKNVNNRSVTLIVSNIIDVCRHQKSNLNIFKELLFITYSNAIN